MNTQEVDFAMKVKRYKYISELPFFYKILIRIGIFQIWYEPRNNHTLPPFRCERFNKYNPATWMYFAITFIASLFVGMYSGAEEWILEARKAFTTEKWG